MNIIFMSSSEFGLPALKKLVESQNKISAVYTQPPKKSGRGLKMNKSVIHQFALQNNLCVRTPTNLEEQTEIDFLKKLNPDLGIVVSYGLIIPTKILEIPKIWFFKYPPISSTKVEGCCTDTKSNNERG